MIAKPIQLPLNFDVPAVRREVGPATVSGYALDGRRIDAYIRPHSIDTGWPWWDETAYRRDIWSQ